MPDRAGGHVALGDTLLGEAAHVGQPGVLTDGSRTCSAQLDAVVLRGIVAGREHRAGPVEEPAGEVELIGRRQTDHRDIGSLSGSALGKGLRELR